MTRSDFAAFSAEVLVADDPRPRWHAPVCAARPELAARGAQPVDPVGNPGSDTGASRGLQAHTRRMFVELDTRHDARYTVSLEWDHDSGETQIVVADNEPRACSCSPCSARAPARRSAIPSGTRRECHRSRHRDPRLRARRTSGRSGPGVRTRGYVSDHRALQPAGLPRGDRV
jgi:hypothetical protein